MTELSFLIELLLNHELSKDTKALVASRIKEVEQGLVARPQAPMQISWQAPHVAPQPQLPAGMAPQAASTLAAMARHPDLFPQVVAPVQVAPPPPAPVEVIAQTPAAAAALAARQEAMAAGMKGKSNYKFRGQLDKK